MYKLTTTGSIIRQSDGAYIPMDEGNRDYAEYLKWVAQGNTPLPADTPSDAEILALNKALRDSLLGVAALAIAPLQDAVDLDMATSEEVALLRQWKLYRVALNRLDLSTEIPEWPNTPV